MAVLYIIKDWEKHFEVAQSRKSDRLRWVATPNKHDGKSLRRLMRLPEGLEIFGAWNLILQVASKCPVRGVLADADGPLTAADIADKTGAPADKIHHALTVCSHDSIGWITTGSTLPDDSQRAGSALPLQDITEQDSTEQDKTPPNPLKGEGDSPDTSAESVTEVVQAWNATASGVFCEVRQLSGKRLAALRQRLREPHWRTSWPEALAKARGSPFCCGENGTGWKATFDWFIRPDTVAKLLEGQYDRRPNGHHGGTGVGRSPARIDGTDLLAQLSAETSAAGDAGRGPGADSAGGAGFDS